LRKLRATARENGRAGGVNGSADQPSDVRSLLGTWFAISGTPAGAAGAGAATVDIWNTYLIDESSWVMTEWSLNCDRISPC